MHRYHSPYGGHDSYRQTREITGSPHSSSPTEGSRRARGHYTSSPLLDRQPKEPDLVIEEVKKMATVGMSKSGHLAQQIHDEFLCCKICLDGFTNPKSLNCLHTFCEKCIENHANSEGSYKKYSDYREFTCPLCRKRTSLPPGGVRKLPDNFLVSSLTEVIDRQKPSKYPFCDICKLVSRKHNEASSKCLDCNKLLCITCVEQHRDTKVTANHNIFNVEIEKEIECKEHSDEVVRFYCESCETAICILCTFNDHKDHDVTQFSDAVKKYKGDIESLLSKCTVKLEQFGEQLEVVNKCEATIRGAEKKIHDITIDMIAEIRNREKILIEEIHNIYGVETMSLVERKNELQANHDALKSTVQLTDLVVQGKDMELLLIKKEVQQKLESLSTTMIGELPTTATKVIRYIPGTVDMGYIHDNDRPLLSAVQRTISFNEGQEGFNIEDFISNAETQTEQSMSREKDSGTNTTAMCTTDEQIQTDPIYHQTYGRHSVEPVSGLSGEAVHRSRYIVHQSSVDSNIRYPISNDDELSTQRRRRRRERARNTRMDADRYSYPGDTTSSGVTEQPAEVAMSTIKHATIKHRPVPVEPIIATTKASVHLVGSQKSCELQ